jgi:hypothetical protein
MLAEFVRDESASGLGGVKQGRRRLTSASTVSDVLEAP